MPDNRKRRLAGEFRKILSEIIHTEIKDPRLSGLCSITDVEITKDLKFAKVKVSVLGTEEEKKSALDTLKRASGYVRKVLAENMSIRRVPELLFVGDDSIEYSIHISKVIEDMHKQSEAKNEQ
jgi:ribosome-binding factor A